MIQGRPVLNIPYVNTTDHVVKFRKSDIIGSLEYPPIINEVSPLKLASMSLSYKINQDNDDNDENTEPHAYVIEQNIIQQINNIALFQKAFVENVDTEGLLEKAPNLTEFSTHDIPSKLDAEAILASIRIHHLPSKWRTEVENLLKAYIHIFSLDPYAVGTVNRDFFEASAAFYDTNLKRTPKIRQIAPNLKLPCKNMLKQLAKYGVVGTDNNSATTE